MKDFKSLPQYGNRSKKFVNRYKTNNRVAILKDKQMFALNTATLTFVPNNPEPTAPYHYVDYWGHMFILTSKVPYRRECSSYHSSDTQRRNAKCSCGSGLKYKKCCMK